MAVEPMKMDDDDLLTAYLDNELSETEAEQLRRRLVTDDDLRKRLAELQKAWDMLDDLPDPTAGQAFTKSTLELVTASIADQDSAFPSSDDPTSWTYLRRYWRFVLMFALASLGLVTGLGYRFYSQRSQLRSLELVANFQGLKILSEISKNDSNIQQLVDRVTSVPDWERLADAVYKSRMLPDVPKVLGQRTKWLDELTSEQKAIMWRNDRDFGRASRSEISRLYAVNSKLNETKDVDITHRVLNILAAVVEAMPDNERAIFRSLPEAEKLKRVRELCCLSLANWYAEQFDSANPDELVQAEYASVLAWMESLPPVVRETFTRNILFRRNTLAFEEALIQNLSPSPRAWFMGLSDKERQTMAVQWAFAVVRAETTGNYPENTLFQYYMDKDSRSQESMDMMSPTELNNQLSRELFRPRRAPNNQGDRRNPRPN